MKRLALAALAAVLVTPAHAVVWTPGGWHTPPCCQGYPPFRVQPFAESFLVPSVHYWGALSTPRQECSCR